MQIHIKVLGFLTTGEYLLCGLGINFLRNLYSEKLIRHSTRAGQDLITFRCNYLNAYAQLPQMTDSERTSMKEMKPPFLAKQAINRSWWKGRSELLVWEKNGCSCPCCRLHPKPSCHPASLSVICYFSNLPVNNTEGNCFGWKLLTVSWEIWIQSTALSQDLRMMPW